MARSNQKLPNDSLQRNIYVSRRRLSGAGLCTILLHGYTSSPHEFYYFADTLEAKGYDYWLPQLPGHTGIPEDLLGVSIEDLEDYLIRELGELSKRYDSLVLVGSSMGASLATTLACSYPDQVKGLVLAGMYYQPKLIPDLLIPPVAGFMQYFQNFMPKLSRLAGDEDLQKLEGGVKNMPWSGLLGSHRYIAKVDDNLPRISCPVLVLQAASESLAKAEAHQRILDKLPAKIRKESFTSEKGKHVLFNDRDFNPAQQAALKFIESIR